MQEKKQRGGLLEESVDLAEAGEQEVEGDNKIGEIRTSPAPVEAPAPIEDVFGDFDKVAEPVKKADPLDDILGSFATPKENKKSAEEDIFAAISIPSKLPSPPKPTVAAGESVSRGSSASKHKRGQNVEDLFNNTNKSLEDLFNTSGTKPTRASLEKTASPA